MKTPLPVLWGSPQETWPLTALRVRLLVSPLLEGLAVFALDPHPVHGHLLSSVHLEAAIHQILDFLQASRGEQQIQLI